MENISLKQTKTANDLVDPIVKWQLKGGALVPLESKQKALCALRKALTAPTVRYLKSLEEGKPPVTEQNCQYFLEMEPVWLPVCEEHGAGKDVTYTTRGRAKVGQVNMVTDQHSQEVIAFDLTFKDAKSGPSDHGLPTVAIVNGTIEILPRGSSVSP